MFKRISLLVATLGLLGLVLYAQEPARQGRGLVIERGNIVVSTGMIIPTSGNFLHMADGGTITSPDSNNTYTTDGIRYGWIRRESMTSNRTDALPTAANLVAEFPGIHVGTTHQIIIENLDSSETVTVNGASTGVTYSGSCGTAVAANEAMMIILIFTNVTSGSEAYRAICLTS